MSEMLRLFAEVEASEAIAHDGLGADRPGVIEAGTRGTIVETYVDGRGDAVEFFAEDGRTIDVVWLDADKVRAVANAE